MYVLNGLVASALAHSVVWVVTHRCDGCMLLRLLLLTLTLSFQASNVFHFMLRMHMYTTTTSRVNAWSLFFLRSPNRPDDIRAHTLDGQCVGI